MLLSQVCDAEGILRVVMREAPGGVARQVEGLASTRALALEADASGQSLDQVIAAHGLGAEVDLLKAAAEQRIALPISHDDPAHLLITGTGLTHLGSAATRDAMHSKAEATPDSAMTDSMKMFRMGVEGGRPAEGRIGVQPEWFYKGNGSQAVPPGAALTSPGFAEDGGEEPELAGIYVIAADGTPLRLGFALGNEFSDHVTERVNYLWLAHSKLRQASFGPEILTGPLPADIRGMSRIWRGDTLLWEKPFLSGEANMSHSFANLEHHHFKYPLFRQPGDVHVHMFGTATLSFADGVKPLPGDRFDIEAAPFGLPLSNPLAQAPRSEVATRIRAL